MAGFSLSSHGNDQVQTVRTIARIAQMLIERLFTNDNYEGNGEFRIRGAAFCPKDPLSGAPAADCVQKLDAAEIRLRAGRTDGSCRIEVIDSGPGLPHGDLTRVFERFYRVDKSRSRPGTGLGLAIVKHLVELHGGTVVAANRPEGGAVFTVTLPGGSA